MGNITKFGIERLEARHVKLALDCPNCGSARVSLSGNNGSGIDGVRCPKCRVNIILDSLNLTVVNENIRHTDK